MSIEDDARKAKDLLEEGWCKRVSHQEVMYTVVNPPSVMAPPLSTRVRHEYCMTGAAAYSGIASSRQSLLIGACAKVIMEQFGDRMPYQLGTLVDPVSVVVTFNDSPITTRDEVLSVLEKVIAGGDAEFADSI